VRQLLEEGGAISAKQECVIGHVLLGVLGVLHGLSICGSFGLFHGVSYLDNSARNDNKRVQ
jgi:hypothetical protein